MARSIFFKLIQCECCGDNNHKYNYVFIRDRKIPKYICSGYSRIMLDGCKVRYTINEEELLYLVQIYCNRNRVELIKTNEFMKSIIEKIYIDREKQSINIKYKNGEDGIYSLNEIHI